MNPLLNGLAPVRTVPLNRTDMTQASEHFVGTHDFRSVASNRNYAYETTVRSLSVQCHSSSQ